MAQIGYKIQLQHKILGFYGEAMVQNTVKWLQAGGLPGSITLATIPISTLMTGMLATTIAACVE